VDKGSLQSGRWHAGWLASIRLHSLLAGQAGRVPSDARHSLDGDRRFVVVVRDSSEPTLMKTTVTVRRTSHGISISEKEEKRVDNGGGRPLTGGRPKRTPPMPRMRTSSESWPIGVRGKLTPVVARSQRRHAD
jgi:hypothetical protein